MNLTLRQLRAFAAVADTGSFTEAARQLHLTQSALSVLVRELERELGVRLFDRHTRRVQLAEAGRDFLPHVQRVMEELQAATASVGSLRDKRRGSLRVAAPQLMACTLMPRVIAAYAQAYPDIEVRLLDSAPEQTLARVVAGEAELAIAPDSPVEPVLIRQVLMRDDHWLVCPADHPLARRKRVRWRELQGQPFIAPARDFLRRLAPALAAAGETPPPRPVHEVSYMTTALGLVAAGAGVTACPSYGAPLAQAWGLQMRPLVEPTFLREVCIHHQPQRSLSPAAQSFVDFLRRFVAAAPLPS
ncbi:LysR family transcriptional regulator [Aquabacterium sp. J223]|uniref:LysR family transcriptional regulator n=1 Tax=Aquabacterium sp. J223 TaxID=2898431 RepID=UPI0021ADE4DA|nr:LysR family transcriptional regulator [Aquabacterium sp. J223]UUX97068.1 LysR substrate-binding domain-containing protein [Aquabacterium sp. J223]